MGGPLLQSSCACTACGEDAAKQWHRSFDGGRGGLEFREVLLEGAEADELVALEVLLPEPVLDHLSVQFLHALGEGVLELEAGEDLAEQIEVHAVVARVGPDLAGVG